MLRFIAMGRHTACCFNIFFITTFYVLLIFVQAAEVCKYTLTSQSGVLMSPNFPEDYPNDTECTWNIHAPEGHYVSLTFDILDVEAYNGKCIDVIEVKDGATSKDVLLGSYCETNRPSQVLTSSFNHLRIWFYTDYSDTRRGFNASYTVHKETGCGERTNNKSGIITSPRFGKHSYPSGISCEWVITRPTGEYVHLTFSDFGMEFKCRNAECMCLDKLEIWDGPTNNASHVGSLCRLFQPPIYVSRSNRVRLVFTSNEEGRFLGFRVQFTTSVTPGCGGDFSSMNGYVFSPNYPNPFPAFSHCIWRVSSPGDHYISMRFTEFVGLNGTSPSCPLDYLQVLDGFTNKAPQLGRYCQENIPSVVISTGPHLFIQFRSQLINSIGRFKAVFMLHSRECTASLGVSDGRISDAQLTASSFLRQQVGIYGRLFLPRFGRINNQNSFVPSWCSQTQNYNNGKTVGEYFQIDLRNLTNITGVATQGLYMYPAQSHFVTTYKVEYSFNGSNWISYIGENPNDTSKGYTEFVGNLNAYGIVQNAFKPTIIANMIRIIPTSYISPFRHICLKSEIFGCSFSQECGGLFSTMELDEISIRTTVKHGKKCTWFSVPGPSTIPGLVLILRFTYFDLPCDVGRIIIEERRSGKTKSICGSTIPPSFLSKISEPLAITIDAEPGSETVGFNIKSELKTLGCGEIIRVDGTESAITSPNYPEPYAADQECSWILITTPGYQITLNFETFDLEKKIDSECKDYVEIRDGQFESAPVIDRFCGSDNPPQIVSTDRYLYLSFQSNNKTEGNGFRALHKNVFRGSAQRQRDGSKDQDQYPEEKSRSTASSFKINVVYQTLVLVSIKLVCFT